MGTDVDHYFPADFAEDADLNFAYQIMLQNLLNVRISGKQKPRSCMHMIGVLLFIFNDLLYVQRPVVSCCKGCFFDSF
jgi:hypothetical protein